MVEHQSDRTEVEYPNNAPGDTREVFDYVVRNGPISHSSICDNTPFMSPNEIFDSLVWLADHEYVERIEGGIEEHGSRIVHCQYIF